MIRVWRVDLADTDDPVHVVTVARSAEIAEGIARGYARRVDRANGRYTQAYVTPLTELKGTTSIGWRAAELIARHHARPQIDVVVIPNGAYLDQPVTWSCHCGAEHDEVAAAPELHRRCRLIDA